MKINKTFRTLLVVVSVPAIGLTSVQAAILKLSGAMPSNGDVKEFQISPNSRLTLCGVFSQST